MAEIMDVLAALGRAEEQSRTQQVMAQQEKQKQMIDLLGKKWQPSPTGSVNVPGMGQFNPPPAEMTPEQNVRFTALLPDIMNKKIGVDQAMMMIGIAAPQTTNLPAPAPDKKTYMKDPAGKTYEMLPTDNIKEYQGKGWQIVGLPAQQSAPKLPGLPMPKLPANLGGM